MVSHEDQQHLEQATELLRDVIARHRSEDLRVITILNDAIQDIRISARYLAAVSRTARP